MANKPKASKNSAADDWVRQAEKAGYPKKMWSMSGQGFVNYTGRSSTMPKKSQPAKPMSPQKKKSMLRKRVSTAAEQVLGGK